MSVDPVPTATRWAYAAPAFALAVVGIPIYVYVPKFYTDVVGVDVAVVGALLFGVRLFDAVSDPLIGRLSDRIETRHGRRRPWIALGAWPLAVAIFALFAPPDLGARSASLWLGFWIFSLFLFWTAVAVPYESLGPELTADYDERTSILGLRDGVLMGGTLLAAASPAIVSAVWGLGDDAAGERETFRRLGQLYAPLLIVLCMLCASVVSEKGRLERAGGGELDLRGMLRNRPFRILLGAYTISALGSNLPATLILYYVQYVLEAQNAEVFLVLYLVTGIAFLPGWVRLAHRVGKKGAWLASMAVNTGAFFGVFFLGPGDTVAYGVLVFLSGIGLGATLAIPSAIQADVIDYDELRSGARREGQYIGVWSIARKLAAALGVGLALIFLGTSGYEANVAQTPEVRLVLRTLYALVPCLCNAAGFGIALAYPLDRERHRAVLEAIRLRREGVSVRDPLRAQEVLSG